jgi:hypothetical protein
MVTGVPVVDRQPDQQAQNQSRKNGALEGNDFSRIASFSFPGPVINPQEIAVFSVRLPHTREENVAIETSASGLSAAVCPPINPDLPGNNQ